MSRRRQHQSIAGNRWRANCVHFYIEKGTEKTQQSTANVRPQCMLIVYKFDVFCTDIVY
jgi:hypothetical protein